jgi:murein L,D-transpeptidase YafK
LRTQLRELADRQVCREKQLLHSVPLLRSSLLGGEIMVHGIQNCWGWIGKAHCLVDWTVGCIAVTDPEIEELYRIVPDGTPIEIGP